MKMKQITILVTVIAALTITLASCDDRPIQVAELPVAAQAYIQENYPDSKVMIAKKDCELFSTIYEVKLDNGLELNFDSDGLLYDVDD